jgi:hypothetical protein
VKITQDVDLPRKYNKTFTLDRVKEVVMIGLF